ncbi:tetratricopeptide repeat protein [Streptomyces griseocarneus]|uniref:tetratricopeptide repeat protein n=1 Tax=Streptomyces griseocarneus TaxID=51201 RepID=UPI00167E56DF|nr:tetratricopeptide repeat protein [Streptomyces griseocarneus]MBZ6474369.1 tetratricopeptide repeat protein [Streptomyces griseocarneus]
MDTASFVGRRVEVEILRKSAPGSAQVIYGLGGIGKTRTALEYARVGIESRSITWWIVADSAENLTLGLANLTQALYPELSFGLSTAENASWAIQWLRRSHDWLLVLDNVEDPAFVRATLADMQGGRIIATSRRRHGWDGFYQEIPLESLSRTDSWQLIASFFVDLETDWVPALHDIAEELGDLPLALVQAGSYMTQAKVDPKRYLDRLRSQTNRMHRASIEGRDPERTIARVWDITLEAIGGRSSEAITILEILAHYASGEIPRDVVSNALEDELDVDDALRLLSSYSMIQLGASLIDMHRLVQSVVRSKIKQTDHPVGRSLSRALDLLADSAPESTRGIRAWPRWRALVPHIEELMRHMPSGQGGDKLSYLLGQAASFYSSQDQQAEAVALRKRALEAIAAEDRPAEVVTHLSNIAEDFRELGEFPQAIDFVERSIDLCMQAFGGRSSEMLTPLMVRAAIRRALGDTPGAMRGMREVQELVSSLPASEIDNGSFLTILNNSAAIARDMGMYDQSLPLLKEALRLAEESEVEGPEVVMCLNNIAALYRDMGRASKGLSFAKRALAASERMYGERHTAVIASCSNLAALYRVLDRPDEAMVLAHRALSDAEDLLGPESSTTAICMNNLCADYIKAGRYSDALPLAREALRITEANLGDGHSSVANRLSQMGAIYFHLGRYSEALPYTQRAVEVAAGTVGKGHPLVISCIANLALNYLELGDTDSSAWIASEGYSQAVGRYGAGHETTRLLKLLSGEGE